MHFMTTAENMWITTWGGGVNFVDTTTKEVVYYQHKPSNPNSLSSNNLFYGIEDSEGVLWFTTGSTGLNIYNPDKKQFSQFLPNPDDPGSIGTLYTRTVYEDRNKTVLGRHLLRLVRICQGHWQVLKLTTRTLSTPDSLQNEQINAIKEDSRRRLWVGTSGAGLHFFDRENKKFIAITKKKRAF